MHQKIFSRGRILSLKKKVLLRERKRYTARRVAIASPCYSGRGGGSLDKKFFPQSEHVSSQIWCQKFFPLLRPGPLPLNLRPGTPPRTWTWDPSPDLDLGPPQTWTWDPPLDLDLGPPPGPGNPPPTWTWDPPLPGPGTPPPPPG